MSHHTGGHAAVNDCIENCPQCHAVCLETISHCLSQGGKHAAPGHVALLATCADICSTSADTMLRGASVHTIVCGACAEICARCA